MWLLGEFPNLIDPHVEFQAYWPLLTVAVRVEPLPPAAARPSSLRPLPFKPLQQHPRPW
jgi:hypothetical protein